jgi:hypothetical protein
MRENCCRTESGLEAVAVSQMNFFVNSNNIFNLNLKIDSILTHAVPGLQFIWHVIHRQLL